MSKHEMKYKEGDIVRIKPIEWYEKRKDSFGFINRKKPVPFRPQMARYCGKEAVIKSCGRIMYLLSIDGCNYDWDDSMIDCLVRESIFKNISYDKTLEVHRRCCIYYSEENYVPYCRFKPNKRQCNDDCAYMKQFIKLIKAK